MQEVALSLLVLLAGECPFLDCLSPDPLSWVVTTLVCGSLVLSASPVGW